MALAKVKVEEAKRELVSVISAVCEHFDSNSSIFIVQLLNVQL